MPVTIVATVGSASANSYLTVAEGNDISNNCLGTFPWQTATDDNKARALINATRYLNELRFIGEKVTKTQALLWPRTDAECGDYSFSTTEIPGPVKMACFDIADTLLGNGNILKVTDTTSTTELIPGIPNNLLRKAKIDVIDLEFIPQGGSSQPAKINILNVLPHVGTTLGCLCLSGPSTGFGPIGIKRS